MAPEKAPRRLGRGLDALLGQKRAASAEPQATPAATPEQASPYAEQAIAQNPESPLRDIPITHIHPNHYQPRKDFPPQELQELQESIKNTGLLQPLTVRLHPNRTGHYELVAGERRLRATTQLGWTTVPAIVKDYDDQTMLTLALIENLQRQDLNPIEEAEGYARLTKEFGLTQTEIAELVGKDRSTVANLLRVLALPTKVKSLLQSGQLSLGHARPLLALDNDPLITTLATEAVTLGLSVRAVEARVRETATPPSTPKRGRPPKTDTRPSEIRHAESLLRHHLQTDVSIHPKPNNKGEVRIQYYSYDDLNRLLDLLNALENSP